MKSYLREAAGWTSEALETACGWALYAAAAYAILFVDVSGHGTLWSQVSSILKDGRSAPASPDGVRVMTLGPREEPRQDGIGLIEDFDYLKKPGPEKVLVAVDSPRPVSALTDVPADPGARKEWRRAIKGELRTFTVYGDGSQTTSASAGVQAGFPRPAPRDQAVDAASPGSAYRQGLDAASRPAIGGRARSLSRDGSGSVRNFKR